MKKSFVLLSLLLLTVTILPSCDTADRVYTDTLETALVDENGVPHMTVTYSDTTVQATRGTYAWDNGDVAIQADSMHPLDAKEYMALVPLVPSTLSHINPHAAYLQFPMSPDTVEAVCWDSELFGQPDKADECEPVEVKPCADEPLLYEIQLQEDGCVYEVIATWNGGIDGGGKVHYSFYTSEMVYGGEVEAIKE